LECIRRNDIDAAIQPLKDCLELADTNQNVLTKVPMCDLTGSTTHQLTNVSNYASALTYSTKDTPGRIRHNSKIGTIAEKISNDTGHQWGKDLNLFFWETTLEAWQKCNEAMQEPNQVI
jgi:hypothetical protein